MLVATSCGGDNDVAGTTAATPATSEAAPATTEAAPATTDAAAATTAPADDASTSGDGFELATEEMSAGDVAALPDIAAVVASDPGDLGASATPGLVYGVWDPDRGVPSTQPECPTSPPERT